MKLSTYSVPFTRGALALLLGAASAIAARAEERVLKFEDPSKPGKIVVQMGMGDLRVTGADVSEVTVLSDEDFGGGENEPRDDGLRRLDTPVNDHAINATGNTITIACSSLFFGRQGRHGGGSTDIDLTVPKGTYLVVQRAGPGSTQIENLAGDIEMRAAIGDIELEGVSGGVVVEAAHGDVRAVFASFPPDRPVSISTAHGDVEVRVPETTRANVRFRTLRGEILTDFAKDRLVTKMEQAETFSVESEVNVDVAVDVRVASDKEQARLEADRAREEARQAERAAREAAAQAKRAAQQARASGDVMAPPVPPVPPIPPVPPMPPLAGGKVVAGALNGGGTDLAITALMGDVVFRKATP